MVTRWLNPGVTRTALVLFLSMLFPLTSSPPVSLAEVVTNITSTIGTGDLGTTVTHTGHLYDIEGGTRPGDGTGPILFHSFGDFSVGQSAGQADIANFLNDSGLTTTYIIGRVTGGNPSSIDGIIQTTGFDNANLFLVNPFGIIFGPHGSFNVGGSISFSTAQYLRLFDGINSGNFYANPDGLVNSVLAVAPVVDFGFLSLVAPAAYGFLTEPNPSATITVQGSDLTVLPDQSISLVGGNVIIEGGARLSAPNGTIQLASAVSPGEFDVATLGSLPNVDGISFTSFGSVTLAAGSHIDVSGTNTVFVKGGQLVLSVNDAVLSTLTTSQTPGLPETIFLSQGSSIVTSNSGADPGADVQLIASSVKMEGASISTLTFGPGGGGDVIVTAGTLHLAGDSKISTETSFVGRGGDLQLNVGTLTLAGGATLITVNNDSTGITDDDGNVTLGVGGDIIIRGVDGFGSYATDVTITGRGSIGSSEIKTQSNISAFAFGFAGGTGGNVMIESQSITLDDGKITSESTGAVGPGGDIDLGLRQLTVSDGGQITSLAGTFDPESPGGKITIYELTEGLTPSVALSGSGINGLSGIFSLSNGNANPGVISVTTGILSLTGGAVIKSGDPDSGPQGAGVTINASNAVNITTGSVVSSQASTLNADPLIITTPRLSMNQGLINTSTNSVGNAGDVTLNVGKFTLENGSRVESGTIDSGSAGSITIQGFNVTAGSRADSVTIRGQSGLFTETGKVGIDVNPDAEGAGGNITVVTNTVTLENGASISAASSSLGDGGSVTIDASGSFTSNDSTVSTSAENAKGGDILIDAQSVQLANGTLISASSNAPLLPDGAGNAGNITIKSASNVVMQNSSVTTEASAASGGSIEINASDAGMIRLVNSRVSTSVGGRAGEPGASDGGNINIDPQFVVLQNSQILAQAFAGAGGAIDIIATSAFIADPASVVNASSTLGISGTVNIQSPLQNVGGELAPLSEEFSSAAALLAQQCAARAADGKFSTFVVAAREGLPVEPGGFLASPSLTSELFGSRLSGRDPHRQLSAVTSSFPEYDARPIQLAKLGNACR